jgi:thymidylate kinase
MSNVHNLRSHTEIPRDFFFEFAGMPKSGKTTIAEIVIHSLKRSGYLVTEYHGGGRYIPIDKSARGSLNIAVACKTVEFILLSAEREKEYGRLFILDRGLFDCCIFTAMLRDSGKISTREAAAILDFVTVDRLTSRMDATFLFVTSPELSLERENHNKLSVQPGRVMNTEFLSSLRTTALNEAKVRASTFNNLLIIDTELRDGEVLQCARSVTSVIEGIIENARRSAQPFSG